MEATKVCKDCHIEKPLSEFPFISVQPGAKRNRRNQCKVCRASYLRAYSEAHRKKKGPLPLPGYRRCTICGLELPVDQFYSNGTYPTSEGLKPRLASACKQCTVQKVMYYNRDNADAQNRRNYVARLKREYGITMAEYEALVQKQDGLCAICRFPPREGHRLAVDHDHETGQIRGLLCDRCNLVLGMLESSPGALQRATEYLNHN